MNLFTFDLKDGIPSFPTMDQIGHATTPQGGTGDPVDNFFRRMPAPTKDSPSLLTQQGTRVMEIACQQFVVESMFRQSTDSDFDYLLKNVKKASTEPAPAPFVLQQLAMLALTKGVARDDESFKARYLRFCRWVVQGRKDEAANFDAVVTPSPAIVVSKAFLPEDAAAGQCAECGKQGATKHCSGCLIRENEHATFATSYCGGECQEKHWKKHRALCRQVQQINRATTTFQPIFEHFLALTCPDNFVPSEIAEKHGMVVVKYRDMNNAWDMLGQLSGNQQDKLFKFPLKLASSPDIGRAALMHSRCGETLTRARTLFEMLIRPSCAKIQDVSIDPKNMHKPVHISNGEWDELNALMGHEVFLATLPCGMTMALDPTGMQFGWKEHISPWSSYKKHRVHHITGQSYLGPNSNGLQDLQGKKDLEMMALMGIVPPDLTSKDREEQRLMETVVRSLEAQIKERFGGVTEFLRLKGGDFATAQTAVVEAAKRGLTMLADEINAGAEMRMIRVPSPVGSSGGQKTGSGTEIIWSKKRAKQIAGGDEVKLRRLWKARWDHVVGLELPTETLDAKGGQA